MSTKSKRRIARRAQQDHASQGPVSGERPVNGTEGKVVGAVMGALLGAITFGAIEGPASARSADAPPSGP